MEECMFKEFIFKLRVKRDTVAGENTAKQSINVQSVQVNELFFFFYNNTNT